MDIQITNKLHLAFYNSLGGTNTLMPKYFKDEWVRDTIELQAWMDRFSGLDLFEDVERGLSLYTEKKGARLVETKTTQLF